MVKKTAEPATSALDVIALVVSIIYMQSVLTVAHHASHWRHDGSARIVESPAVAVLVIGLILCGYSWYKMRNPSMLVTIALTVFATASLFWLSGLRTNFYF